MTDNFSDMLGLKSRLGKFLHKLIILKLFLDNAANKTGLGYTNAKMASFDKSPSISYVTATIQPQHT
jgi:hypothetical protein